MKRPHPATDLHYNVLYIIMVQAQCDVC